MVFIFLINCTIQRYYQNVIAETEAGNVTAVSDGVTVVVEGGEIKGIDVFDGLICNVSGGGMYYVFIIILLLYSKGIAKPPLYIFIACNQ